jgi:transposase-like protein
MIRKEGKMSTVTENKTRRTRRSYSAGEKASAVLAVWSGRRRTARVCRELAVNWGILRSWEKRAICGMRMALGDLPGEASVESGVLPLGRRLESLLGEPEPPSAMAPEGVVPEGVKE